MAAYVRAKKQVLTAMLIAIVGSAVCSLFSYAQTADITISKRSRRDTDQEWARIIADGCAAINAELSTISATTPKDKVELIMASALEKIDKIKQATKKQGVIVERFTLKLSHPASIAIDFKFSDELKSLD